MKQPLINDTIDLVEPMEFDRRSFAEVLHRRVEKKSATGSAAGRQQLDVDLHAILKGWASIVSFCWRLRLVGHKAFFTGRVAACSTCSVQIDNFGHLDFHQKKLKKDFGSCLVTTTWMHFFSVFGRPSASEVRGAAKENGQL